MTFEKQKNKEKRQKKFLILENIRSVYNVGAIFRTADAIGIDKIFLVGTTASPIDRFGRERKDLHKAALGAEKNIDWGYVKDVDASQLISQLKKEKVFTIAVEQSEKSIDYKKVTDKIGVGDVAVLIGNEVEGVSKKVLESVDLIAEIPMFGQKESLNVSVATGVILFRFFN